MTSFPMIACWELDAWLESGRIVQVIDLREPSAFAAGGRIWGSLNIPYEELPYRLGELRRGGTVLFGCEHGAKSMLACRDLWQRGWDVADLAGGIGGYRGKYIDRRQPGTIE